MLPSSILDSISDFLATGTGPPLRILSASPVGGGCINQCFRLGTTHSDYFLKFNHNQAYPGMFEKESLGLSMLSESNTIRVPGVIHHAIAEPYALLLLEFVSNGTRKPGFWEQFGYSLAGLHKHTSASFGLEYDNYIGSLPQKNQQQPDWAGFFIAERLEPMVKMARDEGKINSQYVRLFEQFYGRLKSLVPGEKPALLHGDLWSGNFMTDEQGNPCLVDPAVYYGHRETDLAMTRLFGGFQAAFYQSYAEAFPLEKGWEDRMDIHNLYPLMVHVNLFGGGYALDVKRILERFN